MKYDLSTEESRKMLTLNEFSRIKRVMRFNEYVRLDNADGDLLLKNSKNSGGMFLLLTHGWVIFTSGGRDYVLCHDIGNEKKHIFFEVSKELASYISNSDWTNEQKLWRQFVEESHFYFYCEDIRLRFWEAA